jgi:uncharacterized membrane protein (DUF373 family)
VASSSESRPIRRPLPAWLLGGLTTLEDLVYLGVALVLIGIATAGLYNTIDKLLNSDGEAFGTVATAAVNGVLFVVIVLEIFRTLLDHLEGGGFQLRPFLIIGIISAVRQILLVGALSISNQTTEFSHTVIELGVNAGVALVLVIALVLLQRTGATSDIDDD